MAQDTTSEREDVISSLEDEELTELLKLHEGQEDFNNIFTDGGKYETTEHRNI